MTGQWRTLWCKGLDPWLRAAVRLHLLPFELGARHRLARFRRRWRAERPLALTEFLQQRLLTDRTPFHRLCCDKFAARAHVASVLPGLRQARLLAAHEENAPLERITFPDRCVVKAAHGSGWVVLRPRRDAVSDDAIRAAAQVWRRTDYALGQWEWGYRGVPRRILVEEFLGDGDAPPDDYKLFVIGGTVHLISVDQGRTARHTRTLFRPGWIPLPSRKGPEPPADPPPPPPRSLPAMIRIAETLGAGTEFLRVDLYEIDGEPCFGELTFAPQAGRSTFSDPGLDLELGAHWPR